MVRVSKSLRHGAGLMVLCAAVVGCGGGDDEAEEVGTLIPGLIQFSELYSAYGGSHEYQLTPWVPGADPATQAVDPIVAESVKWKVDSAFVSDAPYNELPGGILLTTKKTGSTVVKVTAKTRAGLDVRGEAPLEISPADDADWDAGEARYNNGNAIDFNMLRGMAMMQAPAGGMGTCGLPVAFSDMNALPTNSACSNCHNAMSMWSIEHTPTQTAGYSDEELVQIFTMAMKPMGGTFNSFILKQLATTIGNDAAECIYRSFHTWEIDDQSKRGIVLKLRSITPKKQADIDFARIASEFAMRRAMMQGGAAPADGAAGAAAP